MVRRVSTGSAIAAAELAIQALREGQQRTKRNAIQEAELFWTFARTGVKISDLARFWGRSVPYVSNRIRLLRLPAHVQRMVAEGRICPSMGLELVAYANDQDYCYELALKGEAGTLKTKPLQRMRTGHWNQPMEPEPVPAGPERDLGALRLPDDPAELAHAAINHYNTAGLLQICRVLTDFLAR